MTMTISAGIGWILFSIACLIFVFVFILICLAVVLSVAVWMAERDYRKVDEQEEQIRKYIEDLNWPPTEKPSSMTTVLPSRCTMCGERTGIIKSLCGNELCPYKSRF